MNRAMGGKFIVFEGIDGVGKTTMIDRSIGYLTDKTGEAPVVTAEPGGTPLGSKVRDILFKDIGTKNMAPGVMDLLFLASHIQNWKTVIEPALYANKIVLCDRWWYSQMVYMTRRRVPDAIKKAYEDGHAQDADLCILMHGDVKVLMERAMSRADGKQVSKAWNDLNSLDMIQQEYLDMFQYSYGFETVRADVGVEEVWGQVRMKLDEAVLPMQRP